MRSIQSPHELCMPPEDARLLCVAAQVAVVGAEEPSLPVRASAVRLLDHMVARVDELEQKTLALDAASPGTLHPKGIDMGATVHAAQKALRTEAALTHQVDQGTQGCISLEVLAAETIDAGAAVARLAIVRTYNSILEHSGMLPRSA